jgi:hypothetical protein
MNQSIFTTLVSWKTAMTLAKLLVYVTPLFILLDVLCIHMANKSNLVLKSRYFSYHQKGRFFSTPIFKLVLWFLVFLYVHYALVHKPFIIVIALMFYFITVAGLVVQFYREKTK